jgi:hypothetical protein
MELINEKINKKNILWIFEILKMNLNYDHYIIFQFYLNLFQKIYKIKNINFNYFFSNDDYYSIDEIKLLKFKKINNIFNQSNIYDNDDHFINYSFKNFDEIIWDFKFNSTQYFKERIFFIITHILLSWIHHISKKSISNNDLLFFNSNIILEILDIFDSQINQTDKSFIHNDLFIKIQSNLDNIRLKLDNFD